MTWKEGEQKEKVAKGEERGSAPPQITKQNPLVQERRLLLLITIMSIENYLPASQVTASSLKNKTMYINPLKTVLIE